jgi:hypothetical protein
MEDLKFAFETVIVGLMSLPWLLILFHVLLYLFTRRHLATEIKSFLQYGEKSFAIVSTLVIGFAYCAGTVLFPIADQLFNRDRHLLGINIQSDDSIKANTLLSLYFRYHDNPLLVADFAGLPNRESIIPLINEKGEMLVSGPQAVVIDEQLNNQLHALYNYQKYYDYNLSKGYEILKPLESRIIVLRGAVLNGICLLLALISLFVAASIEAIAKRKIKRALPQLVTIFILMFLLWFFCKGGAWGVTQAEEEYDKHVAGIFYGSKTMKP